MEELRAYLTAGGIEFPQSDDQLKQLDSDQDGQSDFLEWVMGTDPLNGEPQLQTSIPTPEPQNGVVIKMEMPFWFGHYAEVYCNNNLIYGSWELADGWIPTYGSRQVEWQDVYRPEQTTFFYRIHDATIDLDGDGYSYWQEKLILHTSDDEFNLPEGWNGWLPAGWMEKLFGSTNAPLSGAYDDYDSDTLLNGQEIVWVVGSPVVMYSDPTLYDSDNEGLNDGDEVRYWQTDPLASDTDVDGLSDALELLHQTFPTNPTNPDTQAPLLIASMR
jgi:hypothetical protein